MYTHRWLRPPILDRHRYAALVADVRLLIDRLLAHFLVRVNVRLNEHSIVFSLDRMTWRDDRCLGGSDVAEGTPCWELCTTDVPTRTSAYDMLVCTLLIAFRHHFPEITFESELPRTLWSDALAWYRQCFPDRLVVPGPWMAVPEGGQFTDLALLDRQAQELGYRVVREQGMLLLMREGDPRNLQCTNQLFVDDPTGRCELAGWIRLLADRASLIEPRDSEWYRWCVLPGLRACWTAHLRELWFPGASGSLDVRAVVAEEDPAITAWVPRRALNQFIQTPDDLPNYRLSLLEEHGQVRAVRIEELGGFDPESLGFIQVGVLLAVDAGVQDEQLPQSPFGQP